MKLQELRSLTLEEKIHELARVRQDLFHARMQVAARQLKKVSKIRELKQMIAKLLTVIREKRYD